MGDEESQAGAQWLREPGRPFPLAFRLRNLGLAIETLMLLLDEEGHEGP